MLELLLLLPGQYDMLGEKALPVRDMVYQMLDEKDEKISEYLMQWVIDNQAEIRDTLLKDWKPPVQQDPALPEHEPKFVLYVYTWHGCQPCKDMLRELAAQKSNLPFTYVLRQYPMPFMNGEAVPSYPSAELFRDGVFIRRYINKTPVSVIIEDVNEAKSVR